MVKKNIKFISWIFSLAVLTTPQIHSDTPNNNFSCVSIQRDDFGMPCIKGGKLKDIAKSIGRVQAKDRLWQIFFTVQVANGKAAQYFGPDLIESDIMQHQINYTDAEIETQINSDFTKKTKKFYKHYLKGINAQVAKVNANAAKMPYELKALGFGETNPIPEFTLNEILRTNQFILQQFSPSSIPSYQLENLGDFETLVDNFGLQKAKRIFNDINPTTRQVKSQFTIVPDNTNVQRTQEVQDTDENEPSQQVLTNAAKSAKNLALKLRSLKKHYSRGVPSCGSCGQAISAEKSLSGNPMIRIAPQPNYNHPSDFYQIRVECNPIGLRANYFTIPTFPVIPNGIFNNYGVGIQVGHLPSNDFLFESVTNATFMRTDTIEVAGADPIQLPIYRSSSGGWVLTHPITSETDTITTLRSVYLGKQLRVLNAFVESAFAKNHRQFVSTLLNPEWQADILLLEGDYVDSENNISAFHTGGWTKLNAKYDRRLPQGIPSNPAPSNSIYTYSKIAKKRLLDSNTSQGYYVGWNSLFKQGAEGSGDTIDPIGVNRMFWLDQYIRSFVKLSFDDLKNIGLRQYVANNNTAFDTEGPDEDADLFCILFKDRFFQAVNNNPTPQRLQAISFLENFQGDWFEGDLNAIFNDLNVCDKRILASAWLNAVANTIFNPYLAGTTREIATATPSDTVPTYNSLGEKNSIVNQANTLSRIFNLAFDNKLFFNGWLKNQPSVDEIIVEALDYALNILGGFDALPWGQGKRGVHEFENLVLGTVEQMPMCNVAGCVLLAEFTPQEIKMESILALGQSGRVLGNPPGNPRFNKHSFDQQPMFSQQQLRTNPPFLMED